MAQSVSPRPSVTARIRPCHPHAAFGNPDGLHATRPFQWPDTVQTMSEPLQPRQHIVAEPGLDRQLAVTLMRPVGALALLSLNTIGAFIVWRTRLPGANRFACPVARCQ